MGFVVCVSLNVLIQKKCLYKNSYATRDEALNNINNNNQDICAWWLFSKLGSNNQSINFCSYNGDVELMNLGSSQYVAHK